MIARNEVVDGDFEPRHDMIFILQPLSRTTLVSRY